MAKKKRSTGAIDFFYLKRNKEQYENNILSKFSHKSFPWILRFKKDLCAVCFRSFKRCLAICKSIYLTVLLLQKYLSDNVIIYLLQC